MSDHPEWMKALESQYAALSYVSDYLGAVPRSVGGKLQASCLRDAATYSWSLETLTAAAMASRTVPSDSRLPELLPGRAGWWWFGITEILPFHGLLWSAHAADGAVMFSLYQCDHRDVSTRPSRTSFRPAARSMWFWERGRSVAQTVEKLKHTEIVDVNDIGDLLAKGGRLDYKSADLAMRFFLAACVWLDQRVVTVASGHVERHRRKQIAREFRVPPPQDVRVIQLRRAQSSSSGPSDGQADWSCRWVVNGHWRNQPYKDRKKLIYILPYIKGPDDKPLRVPSATVYSVSR